MSLKKIINAITPVNCYYNKDVIFDTEKNKFVCLATDCMIRHSDIENKPYDCQMFKYLDKDKNGNHIFKKEKK